MRTDAEILEAVADGYESGRYGWIQGRYEAPEGFCSVGAIFYEYRLGRPASNQEEFEEAQEAVSRAVDHVHDVIRKENYYPCIPDWNDQYDRTKDEVIDMFKHAAKNARNQETP